MDDSVRTTASGEGFPLTRKTAPRSPQKPRFPADVGFHRELKRRVDQYFEDAGVPRRGGWQMYAKSAVLLLWFGGSYALLLFVARTWWQAVPLAASLALAIAGIGFAVQHDANHGAYSNNEAVNRLMGITLDLLGASSYVWRWKHNIFHHTYTNLSGADEDINIGFFARLAPAQRRRRFHRIQQFYVWLLYGFLLAKWQLIDDFRNVALARVADNRMPRPRGWALVELIAGKAAFAGWAFVVPMLFHPWWVVLLF